MKNPNKMLLKEALKELMSEKDGHIDEAEELEKKEESDKSNSEGLKGLLSSLKEKEAVPVDGEAVVMKKDKFDKEHEDLVKKLEDQDPDELKKEAEAQEEEKEEVDESAPTSPKDVLKLAMMLMKKKK